MRIGIIGDVHLGASFTLGSQENGINTRLIDYNHTLIHTIDDLISKGCSQIVFTGDIFEHRTPTIKQQEFFSAALRHAIEAGIQEVHVVVGNHDQQRTSNATTLSYIKELPLPNIHIHDEMDLFVVLDEEGNPAGNLIFMPYRDRRWLDKKTNKEAIEQLDQELAFHVSSIDNSAPKVVIGHMTLEGTLWMLDQYSDLYNSNDLILPQEMFNSINITIMGHVHTPGIVSKKPFIAYVGSMERRGAFEDHNKKYMIVDLEKKKLVELDEPCREIYDITVNFTNKPQGENLMKNIYHAIDQFANKPEVNLENSIVRVLLSLDASDDKFCEVRKVEEYIRQTHNIFHCVEIKPALVFARQARDENITEHSTDSDAFRRFIDNEFKSNLLKDDMLEAGLNIISGDIV